MNLSDVPAWIGVISALFLIVSGLAGAVAIALSKATTARQGLLESNNKTLSERVDLLEQQLEREKVDHMAELEKRELAHFAEVTAYRVQTESLSDQVKALEKVVTGKEQLTLIHRTLLEHDARVDQYILMQERHDKSAEDRHKETKGLLISNKRLLTSVAQEVLTTDDPGTSGKTKPR